jgi:cytosine/adenosine deaminase-related metal-dependent hydrolase
MGQVVHLAAPDAPVHIHAAEQTKEVDECYAWSRLRPVEWLLTQASVDHRWCIVHATHMTDKEVTGLAKSGAVAGIASNNGGCAGAAKRAWPSVRASIRGTSPS